MLESKKIFARHFKSGQALCVTPRASGSPLIEAVGSAPADVWFAPALFDPQVNGFAGVDFQCSNLGADGMLAAARRLRARACGQFFLTLTTAEWPELLERLRRAWKLRAANAELRSAVAGWHIEGPFLSAEAGYHGAHDPDLMLDPTPEKIRELRAAAPGDPMLITLAPEREGAIEAIKLAVSLGIRVSLGHTNAAAESIARAVQAGASGFTHLGNGCTQALDRHDNIIWRVCDNAGLQVSLIPDGKHVSPQLFRLLHAALPVARICHTTDAMAAAGAPPGRYRLGKMEVDVGADRVVRQPGRSNFAGSALTPIEGVFSAARMLNCSWRKAWAYASARARAYAGLAAAGDFCVLQMDGEIFKSGRLYSGGESVEIQRD